MPTMLLPWRPVDLLPTTTDSEATCLLPVTATVPNCYTQDNKQAPTVAGSVFITNVGKPTTTVISNWNVSVATTQLLLMLLLLLLLA